MATVVKVYGVRLILTSRMLGTAPADPDVYASWIASNAPADADIDQELASIEGVAEETKNLTIFRRMPDGRPAIAAYMIKGFLKEAWYYCRPMSGSLSKGLTSGRSKIDGDIFIRPFNTALSEKPRVDIGDVLIPIQTEEEITKYSRPLRAATAQGPRVALAASEVVEAGAILEFDLESWGDVVKENVLRELFNYGKRHGLGQWRNAGYGSFEYVMTHEGDRVETP